MERLGIAAICLMLLACGLNAQLGEIATPNATLYFSLYPNQTQTVSWGLVNSGNSTLTVDLTASDLSLSANSVVHPQVSMSQRVILYPYSQKLVEVKVDSQGIGMGKWTGTLNAKIASDSAGAGAQVQLGVMKRISVEVVRQAPSREPPYALFIIVGIACGTGIVLYFRPRKENEK